MIVLNKIDVVRNAAKAYKAKKLSAQGPTPACKYRDDSNYPCVIGASLYTRTAKKWDGIDDFDSTSVIDIYEGGLFKTDDILFLTDLQKAHDEWAQRVNFPEEGTTTIEEERLVSLLNEVLPQEEKINI